MKKLIWGWLFSSLWFAGCSREATLAPHEDVNALHERFHGKYKPVSSTASEAVDINLDGKSHHDMFQEYRYLEQTNLELNIHKPNRYHSESVFTFTQRWPEQYVSTGFSKEWNGEPLAYDSSYYANFARQGGTYSFSFSTDLRQILVKPRDNEPENPFRWHRPESVRIEGKEYIQVVNKRRLFTPAGVKDVQITTLYQRYQTTT